MFGSVLSGLAGPFDGTLRLRSDAWGDGRFGAPRAGRHHTGVDIVGRPGQKVFPMTRERIVRIGYPYAGDTDFKLVVTEPVAGAGGVKFFYFYVEPADMIEPGTIIEPFQEIGRLQDVGDRYDNARLGRMTPHLHLAVCLEGGSAVRVGRWGMVPRERVYVDPCLLLSVEEAGDESGS